MTEAHSRIIMVNPNSNHIMLMMTLGVKYVDQIEFWSNFDKEVSAYIYTRLFENARICGHTGIVAYVTDVQIGKPNVVENKVVPGTQIKTFPVLANTTCELKHYDFLRQEASNKGGRGPFPEFTRVGC